MQNLKEEIENLAHYDQCVHVPPLFFSQLLAGILELAEPIELMRIATSGSVLPRIVGAFTFQGFPTHQVAVDHSGVMFICFCSYHNGNSGNTGCNYIVYRMGSGGVYKFDAIYTSSNVPDWVKRAFNEATATATYPGLLSNTMYKRLDAVYNWCVAQGMTKVS